MPSFMRMYPQILREAGYYATNNSKEDYNLIKPGEVWDESSPKAHWRNRKGDQPFFAIFNYTITHESQIRTRPHDWIHDPAKARIPAYHPDTREVREDWAQYYDNITTMDGMAGKALREVEEAGLVDNTIVFFYGDHGSGMPRSKRWPYNSGLHVPLIVHIPERYRALAPPDYRAGGRTKRLVSFVDLAPTLLSLAGVKPPDWMQGHAFLGRHIAPEQPYVYGFRGRMDERYDFVRSVRDQRHVYVRQYMPHLPCGQHVSYMFETPTTRVWKKMYDEGKLNDQQAQFWKTKPAEELFDLQNDPDEVRNLASSPEHKAILERMRAAQQNLAKKIRDVGYLPEEEIHERSKGTTPYEMGHNARLYPMEKVMAVAEQASRGVRKTFSDSDSAVRYWALMGVLMRGADAAKEAHVELKKALKDPSPSVRVAAAEALGRYSEDASEALNVLVAHADASKNSLFVALRALNAIDYLGAKAKPALDRIRALPSTDKDTNLDPRLRGYAGRLKEKILADLDA
jgi:uncharacterized sulfatase